MVTGRRRRGRNYPLGLTLSGLKFLSETHGVAFPLRSRDYVHALHDPIVKSIPALRAFARSLVRDPVEADDLVQETLAKAITKIDQFEPGTRLQSWLFTILRNTFYTRCRKTNRERPGDVDCVSALPWSQATQEWSAELRSVLTAVRRLPQTQREVLVLVAMLGVEYEEAAKICGCPIGTIKSRLNRARAQLKAALKARSDGPSARTPPSISLRFPPVAVA
jgi:RNA polymerase sigma factor (sigma-70 family)